jgi:hypothetical protein
MPRRAGGTDNSLEERPMTHALTRIYTATTLAAALSGVTLFGTACGPARTTAAEARASAEASWKLEIEGTGPLVLERMDIYLAEDDRAPEVFKLYGDGVTLVGEFPPGVHVGYEENLERLIGQTVELLAEGGDPQAPAEGSVRIDGGQVPVVGGTLRVEKVTGTWDGNDGDKTLWGTADLTLEKDGNRRTVHGTFAVHAVSWG